eukprot:SAG22_NODE_5201_length_1063_cov_0.903527_1_plen_212_part_00
MQKSPAAAAVPISDAEEAEDRRVQEEIFGDVLLIIKHERGARSCATCSNESCWRYSGRTIRGRILFFTAMVHACWLLSYGFAQVSATPPCDSALNGAVQPCRRYVDAQVGGGAAGSNICLVTAPAQGNLGSCTNMTSIDGVAFLAEGAASCTLGCNGHPAGMMEPRGTLTVSCGPERLAPALCGPEYPTCFVNCKRRKQQLFYAWVRSVCS